MSTSLQVDNRKTDLDRFHLTGKNGAVTGVFDWQIFCYLNEREDILILGGTPYIYSHGVYEPDLNGSRLKTMIRELIYPEFIKSNTLKRVYDLFITAAELQTKFEELNDYPVRWINFRNGMYDPVERRLIPHSPSFKAVNQIPHEFLPEEKPNGKAVEEWLSFAFPRTDDREMILQYCGYCLNRDVSQQKFMILNGMGGTGKSTLIKLIETVIGAENVSNISLTALQQRFASYGLMGKLLNSCADLEVGALEDTSILKQVLGEDSIRGEQKGKDAVSFKSYAKLIFSTNELPVIKGERTNGFYRRLLIAVMNRSPRSAKPGLFQELEAGIDYFIHEAVEALSRMYDTGLILESEGSKEAVTQMMKDSDSVEAWIAERMFRVNGVRVERGTLYNLYSGYCDNNERQTLQKTNFYKALRSKGFTEVKVRGMRMFVGLSDKETAPQSCPHTDGFLALGADEELPFD